MQHKGGYHIDESALRDKLLNYRVDYNPSSVNHLEDELSHVKSHKQIDLPSGKKILKFALIPVGIVALGIGGYFTFDYINNRLPDEKPASDTITKAVPSQPTYDSTLAQKQATSNTLTTQPLKKDTVVVAAEPKKDSIKKATPVIASTPDSLEKKNIRKTDSALVKTSADTSGISKRNAPAKKKKKKRRNSFENIEDIKRSNQQPNSADDDVVVPQ